MRALLAALLLAAAQAMAAPLDLGGYQDPEGPVRLKRGGDFMDPYFALKALLLAQRYGLDAKPALTRLIGWMLPRQKADGSFDRYCRRADGLWEACRRADADDSMLALWIEALDVAAPPEGAPPGWMVSAGWAEAGLERSREATGVYRIFAEQPVALFMDNVEVLAALRHLTASAEKRGDGAAAARWKGRLAALEDGLPRVFGDGLERPLRISTQDRNEWEFYPDGVAQAFGWLHGYPAPADGPRMRRWLAQNGDAWRRFADHNAPWGIIALAALDAGETAVARDWWQRQRKARAGEHWNVLEEAAYQAIGADPRIAGPAASKP